MTRIYPIKLSISTCFLVEGTGKILIDTGSPGEGERIIQALRKRGVELSDLSLILHTHGHSDHCGSTVELIKRHKIPTAIHSSDGHMTKNGRNDHLKTTNLTAKLIKPFVDKPFPAFEADILVDDYMDLTTYGINGVLHSTPGHTKGSISVAFDNREAIIGDLLMGGYLGGQFFPHLANYHYFIEDLSDFNKSIKKILEFKTDHFYSGHGGPITRESIEKRIHLLS
jgi:glyoxylase-like metal-dependent hydrolase (beta-lactamase superfamily II)